MTLRLVRRIARVPQLMIVDHHPELLEAAGTRFRVTIDSDGKSHVEEIVSERMSVSSRAAFALLVSHEQFFEEFHVGVDLRLAAPCT